jgi:putative peptide zinc metalloprotease protein
MSRIFSASWYRVGGLKPRLRSHAQIHRHQYRGETWYVLQEHAKERFFRFSPAAYSVISRMHGDSTVEEIWQDACSSLGDDAPTQDDMIQLLSQLYRADVLQCDVSPDAAELLQRRKDQSQRERRSRLFSFLSWRVSLFDPDRFLQFLLPVAKHVFSWYGAVVWLLAVVPGVFVFASHWTDLTKDVFALTLIPENFLWLFLLFPLIKVCHEFGHAFATKVFGGEVHDMGVMLLVVTPVPYVDASSASAFREKWRRVLVGASGMLAELFIASLALFVWLNAEPGLVRTLAYNTVFIAGLSTLIFNANPLMRYDGYYILSDYLEIPNLRTRSKAYFTYLCERYLFGNVEFEGQNATASEKAWFVLFGILSFVYRSFVIVLILLFVANKLFNLGAILAIAAAVTWIAVPLSKGVHFLFTSPRIRSVRVRAIIVTVLIVVALIAFISLAPMPYRSGTEGVVWFPEEAFVRASADGFVEKFIAEPGSRIQENTPLVLLSNPILMTQEKILAARVQELEARRVQYLPSEPVKAQITNDALNESKGRLARIREELADLSVESRAQGTFIVPSPEDLPGRFVHKGDLLGYVVELERITVRTVVSQNMIDRVRNQTYGVQVRLSERLNETFTGVIKRIVPGASEQLPAKALGTAGGGGIPTDPTDRQGLKAIQTVFELDIELPSSSGLVNLGGRGYVRFDHGWAPLATQWYFQLRQVFLSRFNV